MVDRNTWWFKKIYTFLIGRLFVTFFRNIVQLIFSEWGIWEIYASNPRIKLVNDEKKIKALIKGIVQDAGGFYHVTERGKKLERYGLINDIINVWETNINNYGNFGLHISFVPWEHLRKGQNYLLRFK